MNQDKQPEALQQTGETQGMWMTVVYRNIQPGDEAQKIGEHPKVSALSWSHALNTRDALHARIAELEAELAALKAAPAAVAVPDWVEALAESWDGCMYDAPGETIDIGESIRRAALAAPQAQDAQDAEPKKQYLNAEVQQPLIRYDLLSVYADKHRLHFNELCSLVRQAIADSAKGGE